MAARPDSPGPSQPSVTVVVPTHNRRALLPAVLAPLLADPATREVVVVVDGSTDGSLELLERAAASEPRLVPLFIENSGGHRARRVGVERASSSIVLGVDDDVVAAPGLVSGHARRQAESAGQVVVGYMPVDLSAGRGPHSATATVYAKSYEAVCRQYEEDQRSILRMLWAGNVSLRREEWLARAAESEDVRLGYHADQLFGLRCLQAGMVGVFDRSLRATHRYQRSLPEFLRDAYESGRDQALIRERHGDVLADRSPAPTAPRRGRRILLSRVAAARALRRPTTAGLRVAATIARWCDARSTEARAVQLMWNVESERAGHDAQQR